MDSDRRLVIGLGNPGARYADTRHNAGAMVLALLAHRVGARFTAHRSHCEVVNARLADVPVVLARPLSYMNDSGGPVVGLARYFKVAVPSIVVVHDDLDLPFGTLRLKRDGGDGGHNGLKSTTASLASNDYARVRFGIGRPPGRQEPVEFVLRAFSTSERKDLPLLLDRAADAVEALLVRGFEPAANEYNQ